MSPEPSKAKSFADILQQNQEFIVHLQALQEDIGTQLEEKEKDLALVKRQMAAKQQETDELQDSQLQWAIDRQALLDQHESLKQGHQDLQQSHDRAQVELGRLKDDVARAKSRDEERRSQLFQVQAMTAPNHQGPRQDCWQPGRGSSQRGEHSSCHPRARALTAGRVPCLGGRGEGEAPMGRRSLPSDLLRNVELLVGVALPLFLALVWLQDHLTGSGHWMHPLESAFFEWVALVPTLVLLSLLHSVGLTVVEALRPVLCDEQGRWTADYTRLRFLARVPTLTGGA